MVRWLMLVLFASGCLLGSRIDAADLPQLTPAQAGLKAAGWPRWVAPVGCFEPTGVAQPEEVV